MIEEIGRVVATGEGYAWVDIARQNACQTCSAQKGCGQKALNQLSEGRASQVRLADAEGLQLGDQVVVGISEQSLVNASLLTYLLPLVLFLVFAIIAQLGAGWPEPAVILSGLSGLALGFVIVKILSLRLACNPSYHPQLLRKIDSV